MDVCAGWGGDDGDWVGGVEGLVLGMGDMIHGGCDGDGDEAVRNEEWKEGGK